MLLYYYTIMLLDCYITIPVHYYYITILLYYYYTTTTPLYYYTATLLYHYAPIIVIATATIAIITANDGCEEENRVFRLLGTNFGQ